MWTLNRQWFGQIMKFNHSNALKNADSWAYFAADLAGALSKGDKQMNCR
jgi:hypothetical protein